MLSRTADHLFWMARYIERAENTARVLDVTHSTSLLPDNSPDAAAHLWYAPLNISGCAADYTAKYGAAESSAVTRFIALDPDNPASIHTSLMLARENARAVRGAITGEMWESINATWLELSRLSPTLRGNPLTTFFDWVKERSHLFRGVTLGTILKDDALNFIRLGTFLERADNTARILDVKYHVLLPSLEDVGGAVDYYQWAAVLRSVSAFESYRKVYRSVVTPLRVAELLILRADMPRSLHACTREAYEILQHVSRSKSTEVLRLAGQIQAGLQFGRIDTIFAGGVHEYLTDFLESIGALGAEVNKAFFATGEQAVVVV